MVNVSGFRINQLFNNSMLYINISFMSINKHTLIRKKMYQLTNLLSIIDGKSKLSLRCELVLELIDISAFGVEVI